LIYTIPPVQNFAVKMSALKEALSRPLPAEAAQRRMAPTPRPGALSIERVEQCKQAAVLILLYPKDEIPHLIFIQRSMESVHHPGQIAFPGGRIEDGESNNEAALRECEEEVGCDREQLQLLGKLTPLYIPPSGFCVHPFVSFLSERPEWRRQQEEVAEVLEVPVHDLLMPSAQKATCEHREAVWMRIPYYDWQGHRIWGATAMMLCEFLTVYASIDLK